ncbi:helix-turn-helix domain-containing protein [Pararhodospirillum oryzae]|uniref:HTH cro/C1-type domain-containing protein n=1 Tax=Pararhodospirillum oryzae TaxID=478448 RepID=A0A512H929_9PROT|nr:hypothetical protein ROR02_20900 [Pararhodospirillum oryzae]
MNTDSLPDRIRQIIGGESARSFAMRAGISDSTLRSVLKGTSPTLDTLIPIARAADVNLEWLATGRGAMRSGQEEAQAPTAPAESASGRPAPTLLDEELFARVIDGISKVYKESGARIAPVDLGRLAARIANDIVAVSDGPDDWPGALKMSLHALARDLRATQIESNSTKRLA